VAAAKAKAMPRQDLAKRRQVKLSAFADAVAPGLVLAQAIDRWATGSTRNFGKDGVVV
jgi:prolipoprotein diacylglyceryltransferase